MAPKGAGSLYRPTYPPPGKRYAQAKADGTLCVSPTWWMAYYRDGVKHRESTGTEKETEAWRILNERLGRVATGQPILPRLDRIPNEAARADLMAHYETTGCRNLVEAGSRLKHLDAYFRGARLAAIGPTDVTRYVQTRQAEGAANGTINREISVLSKLLKLAYRHSKLARLPMFDRLDEAPPRAGFFERPQFEAVRRRLPEDYQAIVTLYHTYGWRLDEVLGLERRQVDLAVGTVTLDPGSTKNDEGRTIYLTPELTALLGAQVERVKALERRLGKIIPALFPHLRGPSATKRPGQPTLGEPIKDFRRKWARACRLAGAPGKLVHDFRRTAVRNMVRVSLSGWP